MNFNNYTGYLKKLENESVYIMREVLAQFENPVLLYSVGKDSSVLAHLAKKAFYPGKIPFKFMHIDTGFKFPEMYEFRDKFLRENNIDHIIYKNEEAIQDGTNPFDLGTSKCCSLLKTKSLLDGLSANGFDAAIGGARRDEEKSRAKERVFSFRDKYGQWNPKIQRPELWNLYNGKINNGESIRVFPLSNWTELDIWLYIYFNNISIVPLYFAKRRDVVLRGSNIVPIYNENQVLDGEKVEQVKCRFRTLGCSPCTGAVRSNAETLPQIIEEVISVKMSERSTRLIDHDQEASMELKKREGYF